VREAAHIVVVMAVLDTAIHVFGSASQDVDDRVKPGHDDKKTSRK
jgi:hypothetical protein